MKKYTLLIALIIVMLSRSSSASSTELERRKPPVIMDRLRVLWTWILHKVGPRDAFVARCFGVARRLKFAVPIIVFKLGVIVTILAFLTIFSLKSLGLLILLVMIHSSGLAAKLAHFKSNPDPQWSQPQSVHLHVHSKDHFKHGHYKFHPDYDHHQEWYEKNDSGDTEYESLADRLSKLHIYDSYYGKH